METAPKGTPQTTHRALGRPPKYLPENPHGGFSAFPPQRTTPHPQTYRGGFMGTPALRDPCKDPRGNPLRKTPP